MDGVKDIFSSGRDKNEDDRGPGSGRDRRLKRKKHRSHPKDQNIDVDVPVNRDVQYHPYDYALPPTTTNEWPAANSQTVNNVPSAGSQLLGVNSNTRTLEMSQSSNPQYMIASRSYSQPVGNNPASGFQNSSEIPGVGSTGILSDHGSPNFNDGGGDLNNAHKDTGVLPESTDNICNLLRKMKSELPDVGFEREFVAPLPLADILVGICNLGNAYTSAAKSKRDLEEEVEEWQVKFQSLETKSREDLVRTRKGFGVTITNLEKDKARLEGSISTLKQASESLEAKQEAKIRKIEDSNEAQIRALNEKNAKQTTQLQRERDDLQNRLWNHEQHATAQMNAELNRRNAEFQEEKNRLIRQVADTTAELSRERSIKSQQITNIYNEHEAEKARMRTAHDKEKGALVRNLEKTIQDLQSALVRREHFKAMSDHELARHFQNIADEVDDFGRIDWDEGLEPSWPFTNPVFASSNNPRRLKQHVIQTTLWVILYDRIFCSPFRVLGNEGRRLEAQWAKTFGQGKLKPYLPFSFWQLTCTRRTNPPRRTGSLSATNKGL